jgi:hypothetical protein
VDVFYWFIREVGVFYWSFLEFIENVALLVHLSVIGVGHQTHEWINKRNHNEPIKKNHYKLTNGSIKDTHYKLTNASIKDTTTNSRMNR